MSRSRNGGGLPARRAMLRWGWRLFRREWRQQVLVLTLMTVAVAAAAFSAAFGYNFPRTEEAIFGSAQQRTTFNASEPEATADTAAAREYFGAVDVISTRVVSVPGAARRLFVRDTDPHGGFTGPMLALRSGRLPAGDEVAVTDEVAADLGTGLGGQLTIDGRSHPVVGIVQNPADYDDEFALVAPGELERRDTVTLLTDGGDVEAFRQQMTVTGNVDRQTRRSGERAAAAIVTLGLAAVGLLLVALIAAAGFVVLAKRRQRQFGLLAAAGATEQQVRLVTVINGALVGLVAAAGGTALGMAAWALALSRVEAGAAHDIPGFSVPLWVIAASVVLAVGSAVASAWWPARAVARIPVMEALWARPPRPRPVHRSAVATVVLVAGGLLCLNLADGGEKPLLLLIGLPMVLIGVLFSAPVAIRLFGRLAGRLPVAGRLALRDLARYQARSAAALAAISLALAIPVGIVVIATAETAQAGNHNLSDHQLLFRIGGTENPMMVPVRSDPVVGELDGQIARLAADLDGARTFPLDMAVNPSAQVDYQSEAGGAQFSTALFWQAVGEERALGIPLYVATPELLARFGAGSADADTHQVWFRETTGELALFSNKANHTPVSDVSAIPDPGYRALPDAFLSPAAARSRGLVPKRAGWLVEANRPLTDTERAAARQLAAGSGITVELEDRDSSLTSLRVGATAGGILMALGVLAMTVGLIRSEVAADLRTLTALGAGSGLRRRLTAATAGALALLGVLVGITAAYLALVGAYLGNLDALKHVPVLDLTVTALGVPLLAVAAGWLLAGRQPPAIARTALD